MMTYLVRNFKVTILSLGLAACANNLPASVQMPEGVIVNGGYPTGYQDFCLRHANLCQVPPNNPALMTISMTEDMATLLDQVNRETNHEIRWVTDVEAFGRKQYWEPGQSRGDCKAISLRKLEKLVALGVSRSALRLATLRTETGEGHLVLTVDTSAGTYVLDNRYPEVTPWSKLPYTLWTRERLAAGGWAFPRVDASGRVIEVAAKP